MKTLTITKDEPLGPELGCEELQLVGVENFSHSELITIAEALMMRVPDAIQIASGGRVRVPYLDPAKHSVSVRKV